jgi:hypothetical protein
MTANPPQKNPLANDHPNAEIMAAIAATIACVFGPGARVKSVLPVPGIHIFQQIWALEGRRQIYASHHPFR